MQKAIIFIRTTVETNIIDKRIDKLINYCSDNNLSVIKQYVVCAKRNNTKFFKNLYEDIKAISGEHINIVTYSIKNFLPNIETLELFDNLVKTGKISFHFCKDNLIYNSQTQASETSRR